MKIHYIETPSKKKLFSFHRHDFKMEEDVGIDGGLDYIKTVGKVEVQFAEIQDVIKDIREQFLWGKNYDKDNNRLPKTEFILLKDLNSSHIVNIIKYLLIKTDLNEYYRFYIQIFLEELIYRIETTTI